MEETPTQPQRRTFPFLRYLPFAAALLVLGVWLALTPPGLLGKADAVGYAVCHRIPQRSFFLDDRPVPLCARCSGMYLGALVGMIYQFRLGKRGGMPPWRVVAVLGLFLAAFGVDGLNSYVQFFPNIPQVYESHNLLRLLTGSGMGLGMAALLVPLVNQNLWVDWDPRPALTGWRDMAVLTAAVLVVDAAVWSENPILLYPLALLSALTVVIILTLIYSVMWTLVLKKENAYTRWGQAAGLLAAGFFVAMLQTGVLDYARYWLTGSWNGFFSGL